MDLSKIRSDIPRAVKEWCEGNANNAHFSFVSVLSYRYGEIVERTFGARRYAKKGVQITEVRRRATGNHKTIVKNLLYSRMCGYIPVFENKDRYSACSGWRCLVFPKEDFDVWYESDCDFFTSCLNADMLKEIDEFKYCGYSNGDVIKYLNEYRKCPLIEFFGKLNFPLSPLLISRANKDKRFCAYLYKNAPSVRAHGAKATEYAYLHNISIVKARFKLFGSQKMLAEVPSAREQNIDLERIADYCAENKIQLRIYNDYLEAVIALGLDLADTKNTFPKDFDRMHDLRVTEYASLKAKADREARKELYEAFAKAGEKATAYEYSDGGYSMIAPRDISELEREGAVLRHCVGKMGYDKRMADGAIVIMFLRQASDLDTPFVTIEYDLRHSKLKQAYSKSNSLPPSEATAFIDKWQRKMKKMRGARL